MDTSHPQFPSYRPTGIPLADPKFHKPLYKAMKMMMRRPKMRTPSRRTTNVSKGIHISPDVHVTEKKVKWY